jgi:hypothetical protein
MALEHTDERVELLYDLMAIEHTDERVELV